MPITKSEPIAISAVLNEMGDLSVTVTKASYEEYTHIFFGVVNDGAGLTDHGPVPGWGPETQAAVQQLATGLLGVALHTQEVQRQPSYRLLFWPGGSQPVLMACEFLAERIAALEELISEASDNGLSPAEITRLERNLAAMQRQYHEEGCTGVPTPQ